MPMSPPPQEEIILFVRYPKGGEVKTRLIPHLGNEGAARLHRDLAEQTLGRAMAATGLRPARLTVAYTGGSAPEMAAWLGKAIPLRRQEGRDLGERMAEAFRAAWAGGTRRAVLIGSDCPGLTPALIADALALLANHDLVLGPAADGGYYLIGLKRDLAPRVQATLFRDIAWGSERVLGQTLARAAAAGLRLATLQELHDIDRPGDLARLHRHPDPR